MSKKCCGILHSEDEKVCRVCGKPLVSEDEVSETAISEAAESDNQLDEADKEEKADEMGAIGDAEIEAVINAAMQAVSETVTANPEAAVAEEAADEETEADERDAERKKSRANGDRAPRAMKVMGILSIIMSVLGLAAVTLSVLFLVVFPSYRKEGAADRELKFESDTASVSDAEPRPLLVPTDTEHAGYFNVQETATGTDATPADASESE